MPATNRWRGPGWTRRAKAAVDAARRNPDATCHHCGAPLGAGRLDADHIRPGDPHSPIVATHASCNRSAGATEGNRRRVGLTTSRNW